MAKRTRNQTRISVQFINLFILLIYLFEKIEKQKFGNKYNKIMALNRNEGSEINNKKEKDEEIKHKK